MILGHYHFVCQKSVAWFNFFETKNNRVAEFKKKNLRVTYNTVYVIQLFEVSWFFGFFCLC